MKKTAISIIMVLILTSCKKEEEKSTSNPHKNNMIYRDCYYKVEGTTTGGFDIHFKNKNYVDEQKWGVAAGWNYHFDSKSKCDLYITAQAHGDNTSVGVSIYYGTTILKRAAANGTNAKATASITLE